MAIAADDPETETGDLRDDRARLRRRLAAARRSIRLQLALESVVDLAGGLVALGAALVALDYRLRLGVPARHALLGLGLGALAAWLIARSRPRLGAWRADDLALAAAIDRVRPGTGQRVADVLQLPDQVGGDSAASPAFVRLAVRRASEALEAADWRGLWDDGRTAGSIAALVGLLAVPAAFAAADPGSARLSADRWLRGSTERWPQRVYLSVVGLGGGARLLAPRDEPFVVEARSDLPGLAPVADGWSLPGRGEPLTIRRKPSAPAAPGEARLRERGADGSRRDAAMTVVGPGRFKHEIPPSSASSSFEIVGGDDWLGPIRVDRVDRPAVGALRLRVREPGAPAGSSREVEDARRHLVFLPDTEVSLTMTATEPIASARVDVHPGSAPNLARVDARTFSAGWTLREATTLEIQVTSASTGLASKPTFLSIGTMKDREPRVTMKVQGVGGRVTPSATIPLSIAAIDDLGLAAVRLRVERTTYGDAKAGGQGAEAEAPRTTKGTVPLPLDAGGRAVLDFQGRHDVALASDPPPVGAVIRLQAEADDKCARGPQVGRSGVIPLQVVSPDELFYEILVRQRAERAKFLAATEAAERWGSRLAGAPTAEAATEAARSLHSTTRQLDQVASKISDSLLEMTLNQVGSPKSHRLLQDGVVDPIRALLAGPANDLRAAIQPIASGGSRSPADAEKARGLHADVLRRMRAILEQMSQWESFVDVVNQVGEVIKIQKDVLRATEKARESRTQGVFDDKP